MRPKLNELVVNKDFRCSTKNRFFSVLNHICRSQNMGAIDLQSDSVCVAVDWSDVIGQDYVLCT